MRKTCEECGSEELSFEWVQRMSKDEEELELTCADCGHSHENHNYTTQDEEDCDE